MSNASSEEVPGNVENLVLNADGHIIETLPVSHSSFLDDVKDLGGGDLAARFYTNSNPEFFKRARCGHAVTALLAERA